MFRFEIVIDNLNGTLWDLTNVTSELTWKTTRIGKPSSLDLTFLRDDSYQAVGFEVKNGDVLRVKVDGDGMFWGRIFSVERSRDAPVRILAYDQLRYLAESDTYVKKNIRADQVIRDQCQAVGISVGPLANTGFVIPKVSEDGQKRLDIAYRALDTTLMCTGNLFVLYDDYGNVKLSHVRDMTIDLILGEASLVYDYKIKDSIDDDTYNQIKLVRDNKKTGHRDAYLYKNSNAIDRWGRLQYYQKVDDGLNEEQIKGIALRLLQLKNREQRKFTLESIGYFGMRAGVKVQVTIDKVGVDSFFLVEECTHKLSGDDHTMSLDLVVFPDEYK
ncbi:hypothetical protein [Cohnella sp. GCM10012308]|uniref:XkdQ/YqbQ family protein n=1 Tax=Cohnella sp. GCM10012308 TaxID=3317329 RepID=UPI003613B5A7